MLDLLRILKIVCSFTIIIGAIVYVYHIHGFYFILFVANSQTCDIFTYPFFSYQNVDYYVCSL